MANKITIGVGDIPQSSKSLEALEKLGRFAAKMQAEEARMQRLAQSICYEPKPLVVDTEAIRNAVSEYQPDPIIPEGYFERAEDYQKKSLETLQSINENTANLYTMVELINKNNENQEELLSVMAEILVIAAAKSKKEAESLFKKVMQKINDTTDNVDTMIKIVGWATTVYNMVSTMLP